MSETTNRTTWALDLISRAGILAATLLLMAAVTNAQATHHVSKGGSHAGTGTAIDPLLSIQAAINAAAPGDTILVHPGTYHEAIEYLGKDVTIQSVAGPETTIIKRNSDRPTVILETGIGPGTRLEGFTITQTRAATINSLNVIDGNVNAAIDLVSGDLDGDGDEDVIGAIRQNQVRWYENLGGGSFGTGQTISTSVTGPFELTLADFDGDGDLDCAVITNNDDSVSWFANRLNEASTDFGPRQFISVSASNGKTLQAADIDGDGDVDVVAGKTDDDTVFWCENRLDEALGFDTEHVISTAIVGVDHVSVSDLDGDGDLDVLSISPGGDTAYWHENTGGGSFAAEQVVGLADNPRQVFGSDVDGDGDDDVIVASSDDDTTGWFENLGGGAFGTRQVITMLVDDPRSIHVVDLDEDGDADVLTTSYTEDTLAWHENLGGGAFGVQQVLSTFLDGVSKVRTGDVNGDGDLDILVASRIADDFLWFPVDVRPATSIGGARLAASGNGAQTEIKCFDLDDDGDDDVIAWQQFYQQLVWYENRLESLGNFSNQRVLSSGSFVTAFTTADLDGDGDRDILFGYSSAKEWLENRLDEPSSDFAPPQPVGLNTEAAHSFATDDIDGDGDLDVVGVDFFQDTVFWLENRLDEPSADFANAIIISTLANQASSVSTSDLDGDGDIDVVSVSRADDKVAWYENTGGAFGTQQVISTATVQPFWTETADLDSDGDDDIVVFGINASTTDWYENRLNEISADFGPVQQIAAPSSSIVPSLGDVDGDGDPDVMLGSSTGQTVRWYENRLNVSSGAFAPMPQVSAVWNVNSAQPADMNGDGHLDMVVADSGFNEINWYEGAVAGSVANNGPGIRVETGASPSVRDCVIHGIERANAGAGIKVDGGSPQFFDCIIAANSTTAGNGGGGLFVDGGSVLLSHVTMAGNDATTGGAIAGTSGVVMIEDSIIWGNSSGLGGGPLVFPEFSDIQGGPAGLFDNIDADPLFVDAPGPGAGPMGDVHLLPGSPAIGADSSGGDMGAHHVVVPAVHPGTGEDLILQAEVNGSGAPGGVHPAATNDAIVLHLESPQGTFVGNPPVLLGQVFTTGLPPTPVFPGILIDVFAAPGPFIVYDGAGGTPFGFFVLPPAGITLQTSMPAGFAGLSIILQGLVSTPTAANTIFASTDGTELQGL